MPDPEHILRDSPADFNSSVAYALHPDMRRLLILFVVGSFTFSLGLAMFFTAGGFSDLFGPALIQLLAGVVVALVGAALFFGGLIGALFKLITDANIIAAEATETE